MRLVRFQGVGMLAMCVESLDDTLCNVILRIIITERGPCITIVKHRKTGIEIFQSHVIEFIVDVMHYRNCVGVMFLDVGHVATALKLDTALLEEGEVGQDVAFKVGAEAQTVAVHEYDMGIFLGECGVEFFGNKKGNETVLLNTNIRLHNYKGQLLTRRAWAPRRVLYAPIRQYSGVPDIGCNTTCIGGQAVQNGGIGGMLAVMGARPDFVHFTNDMVAEVNGGGKHRRFNVNVENVAEIEFDNFRTKGMHIGTHPWLHAHADFNVENDFHRLLQ